MDTLNLKQHAKEIIAELNKQNITKEEAGVILNELDFIVRENRKENYHSFKNAKEYALDIAKKLEESGYIWDDVEQMQAILREEASEGLESYKARKFKSFENNY